MSEDFLLRPACETDAERYWQINNHPEVRAVSFSSEGIPWPKHLEWFTESLRSPDRDLYVTVSSDRIVAVSRIDLTEESSEISVAVDPDVHGRGIGLWTIVETGATLFQARPSTSWISARVKATNLASRRVFEKAGYQKFSENVLDSEMVWEYRLGANGRVEK